MLWFAVGATLLSLLTYWYHPQWLEVFDQRGRDVVFRMRAPPVAPGDIAVVEVDERSIREYGRWPWPRPVQARLIQALKDAGVAVIALDIVYAQPLHEDCPCPDERGDALIAALASPGAPVVGGYFFRNERSDEPDPRSIELLEQARFRARLIAPGGHLDSVPDYRHVETNLPEISAALSGLGAFNRSTDADGLVRSAPLVLGFRGQQYPALSLIALATYTGENYGLAAGTEGLTTVRLGDRLIPVDPQGRMAINFYGAQDDIQAYSARDILAGTVPLENLRGRLVFVGVTEVAIGDLVPTPVDNIFPGVRIHATAAANILQGEHLYRNFDTVLYDVSMIALIPLLMVIVAAQLRRLWQMGLAFAAFGALLFSVFYWFVARQNHLVSLVYPLAAVALAFLSFQVYYILTSQRTTRFLTNAFSSYVAPALVERLLRQPDSLGLSGEKREITVLFSDIRNFTTISERMAPEQLAEMLNQFLGEMTEIILEQSGTLDKYIGDAIMAIFNAPLNIDLHARKGADSALRMIEACNMLAPLFRQAYDVELRIGVGVNTGTAIVGNLGSERRFDYTAIGDTVNLASRLESITKLYGVDIIISDAVRDELGDTYCVRKLDLLRVKGKQAPVMIHQLMVDNDTNRNLSAKFESALDLYFAGSFEEASERFGSILEEFPDDSPATLFAQRSEKFIEEPPVAGWGGVYTAAEK